MFRGVSHLLTTNIFHRMVGPKRIENTRNARCDELPHGISFFAFTRKLRCQC
jgi:hypothetical protein